jgi:Glu-tRNA(Gln) amidotransferase subunit E-like FAD-binding protein
MSTRDITITLSDSLLHQAEEYGLLEPDAIAALIQEAVRTFRGESHETTSTTDESFEEFCARYDQIKISTKGWKFDREELYGDRL